MYIKARGLYNNLSEENKELYDTIIAKTETESFKKLTKKEIAYLGIREKWFLFRDERLKEKVKQWLEDNEIEYIEDK